MRSFVFLLLLVIVFLTGMILGIDRDQNDQSKDREKIEELSLDAEIVDYETRVDEHVIMTEESIDMEASPHFTQKLASFLEAAVKGFYEVIVEILYRISTLFF